MGSNPVEFTFSAIPLGHSGLLITWKRNITTQTKPRIYTFSFKKYIVGERNKENFESDSGYCESCAGQYKIHSLSENTLYEVIVEQELSENDPSFYDYLYDDSPHPSSEVARYSLTMRTNLKSNGIPAKPDFEFILKEEEVTIPGGTIRWYPCGRERTCNNQESGTHFGVTIRQPYSAKKNEAIREEYYKDYQNIIMSPGIIYEVNVYSVNDESKTYSDPKEIIQKAGYSQVQCVNIVSLPDHSVLISWRPPKQLEDLSSKLSRYIVYCFDPNIFDIEMPDAVFCGDDQESLFKTLVLVHEPFQQVKISGLKPEVMYTYSIIPHGDRGLGFEYRKQHKLQVYNGALKIAKPDFNYKILSPKNDLCEFYFQWLPCGKSFDCQNTIPGSNYTFEFKPEPPYIKQVEEYGYCEGKFDINTEYHVTVTSSFGSNFSEPVTKIFKNCNEI